MGWGGGGGGERGGGHQRGRGTEVVTKESTVQRRGLTAQPVLATCQHHGHHLLGVVMELGVGWGVGGSPKGSGY